MMTRERICASGVLASEGGFLGGARGHSLAVRPGAAAARVAYARHMAAATGVPLVGSDP